MSFYYCVNVSAVVFIIQRLLDTLNHGDSEIKKRLSEMSRRITVYRVNEKALTRRYQTMEEMDGQQRKVSHMFVLQ